MLTDALGGRKDPGSMDDDELLRTENDYVTWTASSLGPAFTDLQAKSFDPKTVEQDLEVALSRFRYAMACRAERKRRTGSG